MTAAAARPARMRAVRYDRYGGPDRLRLVSPPHPTYPARAPRRRLDVVFASPELRMLPHREVLVPASAYARASDHLPTWVDLSLDGRS